MSKEYECKETYDEWCGPVLKCIKSLNSAVYRHRGIYESGTPASGDSVLAAHFVRHPELSNHGLRLIVAPSDRAIRHDLIIHVDNNATHTFDLLLIHTSIEKTRLSRLINRPKLREIMAFAPKGSSLGHEEIKYTELVYIPQVIPMDVEQSLLEAVNNISFAIYAHMLLKS